MDHGPLPDGAVSTIASQGRNDLRTPAIQLCPAIQDVLDALSRHKPLKAEMSGSGATCFALFDDSTARDRAALSLAADHPDWWHLKGQLR